MSRRAEKENSGPSKSSEGTKRQKMTEFKKTSDLGEPSKDESGAMTMPEDDSDYEYYNMAMCRVFNSLENKRPQQMAPTLEPGPSKQVPKPIVKARQLSAPVEILKTFEEPEDDLVDPFEYVSDEVILHIFKFLPKKALLRTALVCQRFHRISLDERLWFRIDLANRVVRSGSLGELVDRGLYILRLAQAKIMSPVFEENFFTDNYVSKLLFLDLSMASISPDDLTQLLSVCRLLKKLSLEAVPVNTAVCRQIARNTSLEVLNMAMCEGIQKEAIIAILKNLKSLVALNLGWAYLKKKHVYAMTRHLTPTIMRLNISGARRALSDDNIKIFAKRCPNLVELDISDCSSLTSDCIEYIKKFKKLEYLSVSRCYDISSSSYITLDTMETLRYIDIFGLLTENGLKHMEKAFKHIELNKFHHSSVARPTVTPRRTSIWGIRTREWPL